MRHADDVALTAHQTFDIGRDGENAAVILLPRGHEVRFLDGLSNVRDTRDVNLNGVQSVYYARHVHANLVHLVVEVAVKELHCDLVSELVAEVQDVEVALDDVSHAEHLGHRQIFTVVNDAEHTLLPARRTSA